MKLVKPNILPISLACALVAAFTSLNVSAQRVQPGASAKRPSLVVGIVIDGLDFNRIEQLRDFFGSAGFNRLLNNGVTFSDIDYGSPLDEAAAASVIFTGTAPAVSGIDDDETFDPVKRRTSLRLSSPQTLGNYTDETLSPEALRVSTIADELRIAEGGVNKVHSIAPDASTAIIMAGHAGSSAAWINDRTGKWASTTYYTDLPTSIRNVNHIKPLANRLDTLSWTPSLPAGVFEYLPPHKKIYTFRHSFPRNDYFRFEKYKLSAPANTEVTDLAADYIKSMNLGKGEVADMVNINYSVQPYEASADSDGSAEMMDTYLKLDNELARLFKSIDAAGPGMDHTLVFVAGTPAATSSRRDEEKYRIPSGEFSPERALSLLKVDLMSIFGNGDWVIGYHNGQFYLNHDLIRERGKDLGEIRREAADFLRKISGVNYAATIDEVLAGTIPGTDSPFPPARNIDAASAGDVFIAVAPGWSIVDGVNLDKSNPVVRSATSSSAAFILYPSLEAKTIDTPVDARVIAPTVARLLRIRSPNGSLSPPIRLR